MAVLLVICNMMHVTDQSVQSLAACLVHFVTNRAKKSEPSTIFQDAQSEQDTKMIVQSESVLIILTLTPSSSGFL